MAKLECLSPLSECFFSPQYTAIQIDKAPLFGALYQLTAYFGLY
jgi:hypothetical protein